MKKALLRLAFIVVALYLSSKAFIALFAYQTVEGVKASLEQDYAITYGWISSNTDGTLFFHDLVITPYRLKRSFTIERVEVQYDDYLQLLFGLPKLKDGQWFGLRGLKVSGARLPLEGRDLDEFLALEYREELLVPMGLYACGHRSRIGHGELNDMGLLELKADAEFTLESDLNSPQLTLDLNMDLHELGQTQVRVVLPSASLARDFSAIDVSMLPLTAMRLQHIEKGYFRRLGNFCMNETGIHDRKAFAYQASNEWLQAMEGIGIQVSESIRLAYEDYLRLGGTLIVRTEPQEPVVLSGLLEMLDIDFFEALNGSLKLNDKMVPESHLVANRAYYVPVVVKSSINTNTRIDTATKNIEVADQIALEDVDASLGKQVVVTLLDGKLHEGQLKSTNEYKIEVYKYINGGEVSFLIKRDEIAEIRLR